MEITEVQIKLADNATGKVRAFATIVLDGCFVIRDIRVIQGASDLFLAMPSRRLTARCRRCRCKNHLSAKYCNDCGTRLPRPGTAPDERLPARRPGALAPDCGPADAAGPGAAQPAGPALQRSGPSGRPAQRAGAVGRHGGPGKLFADIVHPINQACRNQIEEAVLGAFRDELVRSKQGGCGNCGDTTR